MGSTNSPSEGLQKYHVIQHESRRELPVTPEALHRAKDCDYNMLTTPITTPLFQSRVLTLLSNHLAALKDRDGDGTKAPTLASLSPPDTPLTPGEVIRDLIGYASQWIDLSSPDPIVYDISRQVLELELSYAAFCGLGFFVIPGPKLHYGSAHGDEVAQYAHAVQEALALSKYIQILVQLPMIYHPDDQDGEDVPGSLSPFARPQYIKDGIKPKLDFLGTWDAWHIVRTTFLPIAQGSDDVRLTRDHQALIHRYMRLRTPPGVVLCDVGPIPGLDNPEAKIPRQDGFIDANVWSDVSSLPTPAEAAHFLQQQEQQQCNSKAFKDAIAHLSCIRKVQGKQAPRTILEQVSDGFQDYLQGPLQPLADNLENVAYEVFEEDPVKYNLYEQAIRQAFIDWAQRGRSVSGSAGHIVVAVVGAGRGPLITRALRASVDTGVKIELWAVEKNPNAFVLLQRQNEVSWQGQVHLVQSDMRNWRGPCQTPSPALEKHQQPQQQRQRLSSARQQAYNIDILISELLGSFADNELSPECLDGITALLNPSDGISIPESYTSYLTPIAAPKLHADILARTPSDATTPNTPWVVKLHAIDYLSTTSSAEDPPSAPEKPVVLSTWSFTHPAKVPHGSSGENQHNERSARLTFPTIHRGVCHGLAGYFEAVLYGDVQLSTHPLTMASKSKDMMSWFPLYFPLKACIPSLLSPTYFPRPLRE
ncbi:MAG: hypothetical protein LQ345_005045 [Seirophora villosa]|nr:MAG: hypothetical protein LQ345_005045 [Seirophora villosa]